jgi:hypothetical protein
MDMEDLDSEEKKTFGTWDKNLNLIPALSR